MISPAKWRSLRAASDMTVGAAVHQAAVYEAAVHQAAVHQGQQSAKQTGVLNSIGLKVAK